MNLLKMSELFGSKESKNVDKDVDTIETSEAEQETQKEETSEEKSQKEETTEAKNSPIDKTTLEGIKKMISEKESSTKEKKEKTSEKEEKKEERSYDPGITNGKLYSGFVHFINKAIIQLSVINDREEFTYVTVERSTVPASTLKKLKPGATVKTVVESTPSKRGSGTFEKGFNLQLYSEESGMTGFADKIEGCVAFPHVYIMSEMETQQRFASVGCIASTAGPDEYNEAMKQVAASIGSQDGLLIVLPDGRTIWSKAR